MFEQFIAFAPMVSGQNESQFLFDDLIRTALFHRFARMYNFSAIPINQKIVTEAVFDLRRRDKIFLRDAWIDGQKFKELFISCIWMRYLESRIPRGWLIYFGYPETETDVDIVVATGPRECFQNNYSQTKILSEPAFCHGFQIKEYFDFKRSQQPILAPKQVSSNEILQLMGDYEVPVLIYSRDFVDFESSRMRQLYASGKNFVIASSFIEASLSTANSERFLVRPRFGYNFVLILSSSPFWAFVHFDRPTCLVEAEDWHRLAAN